MSEMIAFTGDLNFINLADVFQIIGGNGGTGVLYMRSPFAPGPGMIHFRNGNPINASSGSLKGLDAVYSLFGWTEGKFEFHLKTVQENPVIKKRRMDIVLDALRRVDDGAIKKVGPPSVTKGDFEKGGEGAEKRLPVIKGPMVDYNDVVRDETFSDGERIVREGGHGKWIWIIHEGTARVTKETASGILDIARLGPGCFIGSFKSLLFGEHERSATVTAEGEVQLCVLDADSIHAEFASLSKNTRRLLLSMNDRLIKINERAVDLYLKKDHTPSLKDKKLILKKGSTKEDLFKIKEGEAYIIGRNQKVNLPLLTLGEDDTFGYVPFLDFGHEPRSASVLASDGLKVEKLDIQRIQEEYDRLSNTSRNMIYVLGSCITMSTHLLYDLHKKL